MYRDEASVVGVVYTGRLQINTEVLLNLGFTLILSTSFISHTLQ